MESTAAQDRPKWLITAPLIIAASILLTVTLPVSLLIGALLAIMPGYRGAPRAMLFLYCYVLCEVAGVLTSGWIWLRHRNDESAFLAANFALQCWWASTLMSAARVYAIPQNTRLRYVLKKELQWDPCLEIVGNRLPNYFVDRASQNSDAEVAGVVELLKAAPTGEGLLLYPEGTRFTRTKHRQLSTKAEQDSDLQTQLKRWPDLLPPRLGGCLGLLRANRSHDLLFFAHSGFEGSATFVELMNGSWSYSQVHMEFWRVPFADVPTDPDEQKAFLFAQWDRMQQTVERLDALRRSPEV